MNIIFSITITTWIILNANFSIHALDCHKLLEDTETASIDWNVLKLCLAEINGESAMGNKSANIWRLVKMSFDGVDNIPVEAYKYLGYALTAISLKELRNLSMERVEIIEAFGSVRNTDELKGFSSEKSALIAEKVRYEWLGKNPNTYSEYDLMSLGEILCHFNINDLEEIHADAFRNAVEWIGNIKSCPQDRLQAFGEIIKRKEAFGEPHYWSKFDVSIIGNIINGLSQSDLVQIGKEKSRLNRYYALRYTNGNGKTSNINKEDNDI